MCDTNTSLEGKVAIVTGGNSGIGLGAAINLAKLGARVVIASRNEAKLKNARDEIEAVTGNSDIAYRILDLASLTSVRNFVSETVNYERRVDVLVNNAGAIGLPDVLTEDGLTQTMQVNYFGAFLLTFLLLPMLKASAPSRIINNSAIAMYLGEIDFDHWNDVGRYDFVSAVANSKLTGNLFTVELSKRLNGSGVTANSFDPFVVKDTDILNNTPGFLHEVSKLFLNTIGQSKEEVGKQIAYLAADPSLEGVSGENFKFCSPWFNHWTAKDEKLTRRLWEESKKAVKISAEEDWELNDTRS